MRCARLRATLVGGLQPFDLKRLVGRPHDAGHLDRDRPFPHTAKRISGARIVAEEDRAALGRKIVSREPILAHQHGIQRYGSYVADEPAEEPRSEEHTSE